MSKRPGARARLAAAVLTGHLLVAPAIVPLSRLDSSPPPAVVLVVGRPVRSLR